MIPARPKSTLIAIAFSFLTLLGATFLFQNCGKGFQSAEPGTYGSAGSTTSASMANSNGGGGALGGAGTPATAANTCAGGAPVGASITGFTTNPAFQSQYASLVNMTAGVDTGEYIDMLVASSCVGKSTNTACTPGGLGACAAGTPEALTLLAFKIKCSPTVNAASCSSFAVGQVFDLTAAANSTTVVMSVSYLLNNCDGTPAASATYVTTYAPGTSGGTLTVAGLQGLNVGNKITFQVAGAVLAKVAGPATAPATITVNGTYSGGLLGPGTCN